MVLTDNALAPSVRPQNMHHKCLKVLYSLDVPYAARMWEGDEVVEWARTFRLTHTLHTYMYVLRTRAHRANSPIEPGSRQPTPRAIPREIGEMSLHLRKCQHIIRVYFKQTLAQCRELHNLNVSHRVGLHNIATSVRRSVSCSLCILGRAFQL